MRVSIGLRFYLALFVLFVLGALAFGGFVARRAGQDVGRHARAIAREGAEDLRSLLTEASDGQADLMDRAVLHLSDNLGREFEDIPFDVFEGRQDLLVDYLKERLAQARQRNRENSRVIAGLFRQDAAERVEADVAELVRNQQRESERWSGAIFRRMLTWGGGFLLGVGLLIGLVFHRVVLTPLREATGVIETIRAGDMSRRIPVQGSDEIARLAGSFNAMAAEIETSHKDLETRVDRKTAALSASLAEQQQTNDKLRATLGELESTQQQLVESAKMAALGTMARGMAHEFNNILGGISGCAEDLLEDAPDDDSRRVLDVIVRTSRRALLITENLLSFSRGRTGERAPTAVHDVLGEAVALVEPEATRRGVRIVVEAQPQASVTTDARGLQQVFLNLLLNALQASGDGGEIRVVFDATGGMQRVVVEDDGSGIEPDDLGRVFDPFFSTKDPSRDAGGTGLGLSVSLGIVRDLGGTLRGESEGAGRGARFTVTIPAGGGAA